MKKILLVLIGLVFMVSVSYAQTLNIPRNSSSGAFPNSEAREQQRQQEQQYYEQQRENRERLQLDQQRFEQMQKQGKQNGNDN